MPRRKKTTCPGYSDFVGETPKPTPTRRRLPWKVTYDPKTDCVSVKAVVYPIINETTGEVLLEGWEGAEELLDANQVDELVARLLEEGAKCQKAS